MTDREKIIQDAAEAQHILESSVFAKAWDDLREAYIREAVAETDPDAKLGKLTCIEVLFDVKAALGAKVNAGRLDESLPNNAKFVV